MHKRDKQTQVFLFFFFLPKSDTELCFYVPQSAKGRLLPPSASSGNGATSAPTRGASPEI